MVPERNTVQVLILTQAHCAFCEQAQALFARLAQEYRLVVTTLDIATPEGQMLAQRGGLLFPPGIVLDGQPFAYGRPSERQIRRELDRRSARRMPGDHTTINEETQHVH